MRAGVGCQGGVARALVLELQQERSVAGLHPDKGGIVRRGIGGVDNGHRARSTASVGRSLIGAELQCDRDVRRHFVLLEVPGGVG